MFDHIRPLRYYHNNLLALDQGITNNKQVFDIKQTKVTIDEVMVKLSPHSWSRLPQRVGEQPMAPLLVSNQGWAAMVLPGQGQEQSEPTSCDPWGLQHFARPQPRAPVLL